ncbi:hypothetical protein X986_4927 [Burkholderia pseudomallei]|uniref:hypothetical protein n=1 Tax=Burkholderia pseudomallei TaxID=28450 RepID=UPI000538E41D|nr:hypothetical protein X984_2566 [Burkholderia pseudomallei]KGX25150.1 hypothetical protein X986_4927 [Burkholderia pseudomallei]
MDRYPAPMRNLMPWVRDNAAEIADAFLREGMSKGGAIRIAIAQAKHWLRSVHGAGANAASGRAGIVTRGDACGAGAVNV